MADSGLSVFLSYAHETSPPLRDRLKTCLTELKTGGLIDRLFVDVEKLRAADDWDEQILRALNEHDVAVLALSPQYLQSQYCKDEMDISMRGHKAIPILLDDVTDRRAPIWQLVVVPKDTTGRPCSVSAVIKAKGEEEAWAYVSAELQQVFRSRIDERRAFESDPKRPARFSLAAKTIERELRSAVSFSLLSRTGRGWWRDFATELKRVLNKGTRDSRMLLLNPDCEAFSISAISWKPFDHSTDQTWRQYQDEAKKHVNKMSQQKLQLRLLDAHVPYSMLIVKGKPADDSETTLFIELPKFSYAYQSGEILVVNSAERKLHAEFLATFDTLWNRYGSPRNSR